MGQILKDDLRNRIIEAAKNEFLSYGFSNASMRHIASQCSTTVGNLYRYFKSKDELHHLIVFEPLSRIENLVSQLTHQQLSLKEKVKDAPFDYSQLISMLKALSNELVDIYASHTIEFKILIMQTHLRDQLIDWFRSLIQLLINNAYPDKVSAQESDLLALGYANSIFHGVATMFLENKVSKQQLKKMLYIYFNSFAYMLNGNKYLIEED